MTYNKNHAGKLDALLLSSIEFLQWLLKGAYIYPNQEIGNLQDDVIDFNFNNNFWMMNMCFLVG